MALEILAGAYEREMVTSYARLGRDETNVQRPEKSLGRVRGQNDRPASESGRLVLRAAVDCARSMAHGDGHDRGGGNDVSDFWANASTHGRGFLREMGQRVVWRYLEDGFWQAADICLGVMQSRMDEVQSKATSGKMTQADQVLWSKLGALKAEMESQLRQHAEGGDWRPR